MKKETNAAIYLRVSRDDESRNESNSISYQRKQLKKVALEYGYSSILEFVDDGYSGTSFERPGFKAMEQAITERRIEAVFVKDVSRLGRDYLKVGHYVESFFPETTYGLWQSMMAMTVLWVKMTSCRSRMS